ncbi:MAG: hypothetical protein WEB00_02395 [Dehalococcoidia bacterium]
MTPGDGNIRLRAVELAHRAYLSEFTALRHQIVEWRRIQWAIGTTALALVAGAFAFLADNGDNTLFLLLPIAFAYFEGHTLSYARTISRASKRCADLGALISELIRDVNPLVEAHPFVFDWENPPDNRSALRSRLLGAFLQPSIWIAASIVSLVLFLDREKHVGEGEVLLIVVDVVLTLAVVSLVVVFTDSLDDVKSTSVSLVRRLFWWTNKTPTGD